MKQSIGVKYLFSQCTKLWLPVLKRSWWWLVFSMAVEEAFSLWIKKLSQADERLLIIGALWTVLLQLLLGAIGIIIVNQIIFDTRLGVKVSFVEGLKKNLKYVFIESTRALLPVLLKGLLFLIPGVIEGIRLYFVPYIAQFDSQYRAGQVDALERSRQLVRNRFWSITGILILTVVLSMVPRFYLETIDVTGRPVYYAFVFFVCLSVELLSDIAIFSTYIRLEELSGNQVSLS